MLSKFALRGTVLLTATVMSILPLQAVPQSTYLDPPCATQGSNEAATWIGNPSSEAEAANFELEGIASQHLEEVAGTSYCSDYSGLVIFITREGARARSAVAELQHAESFPIYVLEANFSRADLLREQVRLRGSYKEWGLLGSYPRVDGSGVVVLAEKVNASTGQPVSVADVDRKLSTLEHEVPLSAELDSPDQPATRRSDGAPHEGGVEIDFSGGTVCSVGLPVYRNGVERMITAGHCSGSGASHNGGGNIGSPYTTTWPGNADIYGDWRMFTGGSYDHEVYSGALSSNSVHSITAGQWGARSHGSQLCHSGRTTAEICRYYVYATYVDYSISGTAVAFGTRMYHDGDQNGTPDNTGFRGGDSGGPMYSAYNGGVAVYGLVSSYASGGYQGYYRYTMAMLAGIREWDSSVSVFG